MHTDETKEISRKRRTHDWVIWRMLGPGEKSPRLFAMKIQKLDSIILFTNNDKSWERCIIQTQK